MVKKLGNYRDNDVELCRTTNRRVNNRTAEVLMEEQIPFSTSSKKVPFFKRATYKGADTVWVISINPNRYGQARRALDRMDRVFKDRLVVSNF
jgi:hypothetical protein